MTKPGKSGETREIILKVPNRRETVTNRPICSHFIRRTSQPVFPREESTINQSFAGRDSSMQDAFLMKVSSVRKLNC